jgi:membrane-associated phospholipid phosphatase
MESNPAPRRPAAPILAGCLLAVAVAFTSSPARADEFWAGPRLKENEHFTIDPVVDGVVIVGGASFSELLGLILATGEIKPVLPGDPKNLLAIDRVAITQTIDPHAGMYSNFGQWAAYGYAVLDPILSGVRDGRSALLVDAILYAETISVTQVVTMATKIAVRRPRPVDYANCPKGTLEGAPGCTSTDLQLSFFSGHASLTGAVSATAAYLAFVRSGPRARRPWITLGVGMALTAFVSYERVRSKEHFPTDVIMGSMAGAAIGVLVPHFHRRPHFHEKLLETTPMWIGFQPTSNGGGSVSLGGAF